MSDDSAPVAKPAREAAGYANESKTLDDQAVDKDAGNLKVPVTKQAPAVDRAVAYTANLRIRSDQVEVSATRIKQLVVAEGGYVGEEETGGNPVTASLVLRVPGDRYASVLEKLSTDFGEKISLKQSAEDVTEQVADVDARIKSAQSALTRLRALMGDAKNVTEVLRISGDIDNRQADLESLQAKQKSLARRTAFATVTLNIDPPSVKHEEPKPKDETGFLPGLRNGWDAFTSFVDGTLTVVGALLPFAGLAALLAVPALVIRRRRRPVTPPPAEPTEPAEQEKEPVG
ncbi:DUF4349 domain-containing protein [Actinocorallia lasiicapitis]